MANTTLTAELDQTLTTIEETPQQEMMQQDSLFTQMNQADQMNQQHQITGQAQQSQITGQAQTSSMRQLLLSANQTYVTFMNKLLDEPDPQNDSTEMRQVKAALYGVKAIEEQAVRLDSQLESQQDAQQRSSLLRQRDALDVVLREMKSNLITACNTYISSRNPWSARGKERMNMVKGIRGFAAGDAMSTPAVAIKIQVAGADVAAKVQQKPDASFAAVCDAYAVCARYKDTWTEPQKAILEPIEKYMEKHEVPGVTQIELASYVKDVIKAFRANKEHPGEPMLSAMWAISDAFRKVVGGAGDNFVTPGAKTVFYDENAEGALNYLRVETETSNLVTYWSDRRDEPLFTRDPAYSDIKQRMLGHCYMLAALGSVARSDPQQIRDMMKDNGDGTVTVRFYKKTSTEEFRERYYSSIIQDHEAGKYSQASTADKMAALLAKGYNFESFLTDNAYKDWLDNGFAGSPEEARYSADIQAYIERRTRERDAAQAECTRFESTHTHEQMYFSDGLITEEYARYKDPVLQAMADLRSVSRGLGYASKRKKEIFLEYKAQHPELYNYMSLAKTRIEALGLDKNNADVVSNPRFNADALKEFAAKLTELAGRADSSEEMKALGRAFESGATYKMDRSRFATALGKLPEDDFQRIMSECRQEIQKMAEPLQTREPMFVTVTKTVPEFVGYGDKHSRDALWVQLLTKAYVASGLHEQYYNEHLDDFLDEDLQPVYNKIKERITAEESSKPEAERLSEAEIKEKARAELKQSYLWIAGGFSDVFMEDITGVEHHEERRNQAVFDKKKFEGDALEGTSQILRQVIGKGANVSVEQRIERAKPNPVFTDSGFDALCSASQGMIESLGEQLRSDKLEFLTVEDFEDAYLEEVEKTYRSYEAANALVLLFHNYDESQKEHFHEVYMERAREIKKRLAKAIEDNLSGENVRFGHIETGINTVGHRAFATKENEDGETVGAYSAMATAHFDKIKSRLAEGKPVEAGTYKFASGATSLNGEPTTVGFIGGHAYSVLAVHEENGFKFVQLFNPHHMTVRNTIKSVDSHGNVSYSYESAQEPGMIRQGFADVFTNTNTERIGVFTMEFNDFMNRIENIYY